MNSVVLDQASKLQFSEVILQCSTQTKEDKYAVSSNYSKYKSMCYTKILNGSCHIIFDYYI